MILSTEVAQEVAHTVATHGINWQAVGAIAGPVLSVTLGVAKWVSSKIERVITQLESLNDKQTKASERIARLEGPIKRTEQKVTDGAR